MTTTSHLTPVGATPTLSECFVGSLMYSSIAEVRSVLRYVDDEDVDQPAQTVLSAVRALALRGVLASPQLVLDELRRTGKLTRQVGTWLASATTSGACSTAAQSYASAVVAESFRRQAESFGSALSTTAWSGAEADVRGLVARASERIKYVAGRLSELRGGVDDE